MTGWGLVEVQTQGRLVCRQAGQIKPPAGWPLAQRLAAIFDQLVALIQALRPDEAAVEDIFFARNARSALALGHVRGVALLAAAKAGLPVTAYPAAAIKKAVVGYGRATKDQVGLMVRSLLRIETPLGPDVTDALACAVCHCHIQATLRRVAAGEARS